MRQEIVYIKNFIQQQGMLEDLLNELPLKQEEINLGFKKVLMPRLVSWHGNKPYRYSGKIFLPSPWTENLLNIKTKVEEKSGFIFNSVLVNYYRNGNDSISWHADDEPEMDNTCIASVSLGASRRFLFKNNVSNDITEYELGNGDLLLMYGCQKTYQHSIPKTKKQVLPRLSLTFRNIL